MNQITIESALSAQLMQLAGQVILCDSDGRAIGFFSPLPGRPRTEDLQLEPHLSISEIEAMRRGPTGKPLSEILARLGIE